MENTINELKKTKIWEYLNIVDGQYAERCIKFVSAVCPILNTICDYFPYYTEHNEQHSIAILKRIEQIIVSDCLVPNSEIAFSKSEAFILICSAFGHDLGMAILPNEEQQILNELRLEKKDGWKTHPTLQDKLRNTHAIRGGDYIYHEKENIGIPVNLTAMLAIVMASHNYSLTELNDIYRAPFAAETTEIDLPQLASIFCIGDLLEYSDSRVREGVLDQLQEELAVNTDDKLLISLHENLKHLSIGGNLAISEGKIKVHGSFENPDVLNLAHKAIDYIEQWIVNYTDTDFKSRKNRLKLKSTTVERNLICGNNDFHRIGIRMNKQNIIKLISSNSVWNNQYELVIKELLQNSVEACRYRRFNSSLADGYLAKITVELNVSENYISITDNGCGMSRATILNNFLTVGNSKSNESGYAKGGYNSLAKFGIGFWSVFTITQEVDIQTKQFNNFRDDDKIGYQFKVSIEQIKDYTVFYPAPNIPCGTTIKLFLKDDVNINNIANRIFGIYGIIQCSEIPIDVVHNNRKYSIPNEPILPTMDEIFGAKVNFAIQNKIQIYTYEGSTPDYTLKMFILYKIGDNGVTFALSEDKALYQITEYRTKFESYCVCGFNVMLRSEFPMFEVIPDGIVHFIANAINPKGFSYTLNRQRLLNSTKSIEYAETIDGLIIDGYRKFLREMNIITPEKIFHLFAEGRLVQRGSMLSMDTAKKFQNLLDRASDLLCYKLMRINRTKTYNTCEVAYKNVNEILSSDVRLVSFLRYHDYEKRYTAPFHDMQVMYNLLKTEHYEGDDIFFVDRENNFFFDNDPDSYVIVKQIQVYKNETAQLSILVSHSKSINTLQDKKWFIGNVHGIWSGSIFEKKIVGANFAFGEGRFFVTPNSVLANDIKSMYLSGDHPAICSLIKNIASSCNGYLHDSILQYITQ